MDSQNASQIATASEFLPSKYERHEWAVAHSRFDSTPIVIGSFSSKFSKPTDRLYLVVFKNELTPINSPVIHYFSIDDELVYESFFNDFGPLNICVLYRYCQKLNRKLSTNLHAKKKIVHYTSMDAQRRLNSAFLMGAYSVGRI